jgi:hypothetical protein
MPGRRADTLNVLLNQPRLCPRAGNAARGTQASGTRCGLDRGVGAGCNFCVDQIDSAGPSCIDRIVDGPFHYRQGGAMLSSSIGNGNVLLWFFEIFLFVAWFWLLMTIATDLFRDHESSGVTKALWIILILFFPFIGVFAYLIVRGSGMSARAARSMREAQQRFDAHVREVAGATHSPADQIQQAKALLDAGTIDRTEFDRLKAKALQ